MIDRFETFTTTITQINRCIQKIKSHEIGSWGLKGTHVMCLYSLGKKPEGLTAAQLSKVCGEDKAAVSRTISELTEKNFVTSDTDTEKRAYRTKLLLTEKGKEVISFINDRVSCILDFVGKGMDSSQRDDFYKALTLIAGNLTSYVKAEAMQ